jgi:hypothetical protein
MVKSIKVSGSVTSGMALDNLLLQEMANMQETSGWFKIRQLRPVTR